MSILEEELEKFGYYPDGTMREHHQKFLLSIGETEETIAMFEQIQKEEIAEREMYRQSNYSKTLPHFDWTEWEDAIYED